MIRRINSTNRIALDASDIIFTLGGASGDELQVVGWNADAKTVPARGEVVVEAYTGGSPQVLRFPWGTWAEPSPPADRSLSGLGASAFLFDFKVVEPGSGRLLAAAWGLRSASRDGGGSASSEPLLEVNRRGDMGQLLWALEFRQDTVWLNVNNQLRDIDSVVRGPLFRALVFPAIIREVLAAAMRRGAGDEDEGWARNWIRWARCLEPLTPDVEAGEGDGPLSPEQSDWIDRVVRAFCDRQAALEGLRAVLETSR